MILVESKSLNILAIFAHPDDLTFYSAGTIARFSDEGHNITAICCTSGDLGTLNLDLTKKQVAEMREKELKAANAILGINETIILGYPDGGFIDGKQLRVELIYYVRKYKADRVITFDPWVTYEIHPDHVIVGRMAAEAAAFSSFPLLHPEQLKNEIEPYACSEIWFMGMLGHSPNYFVDITSSLERKIEAGLKFEATLSLLAEMFSPDVDPANVSPEELKKLSKYATRILSSMATAMGKKVGIKAAEPFYVQKILPGHFDNFQQMMSEMIGNPPPPPKIY